MHSPRTHHLRVVVHAMHYGGFMHEVEESGLVHLGNLLSPAGSVMQHEMRAKVIHEKEKRLYLSCKACDMKALQRVPPITLTSSLF